MEPPSADKDMIHPDQGWRIFRLTNGWGAMVFDPVREEPSVRRRVSTQGAGDGETRPIAEVASYLYSQQGEAPQAVLRACEGYSEQSERSTKDAD